MDDVEVEPVCLSAPYPTRYEAGRVIATRALMLANGAKTELDPESVKGLNVIEIAKREWHARKMNMMIQRHLSNGDEQQIHVSEMLRTSDDEENDLIFRKRAS